MAFPGQTLDRFFHSALSSLSLLFIQCPGGSFLAMMFHRPSLFRFPFAAVNTHIVAKSMLVCVPYGYNDRLKRFLSFSVRGELWLRAVISGQSLLPTYTKQRDWLWMSPLAHFFFLISGYHKLNGHVFQSDAVSGGDQRKRRKRSH